MNIPRWIARREPNWQQLDALLKQVEKKSIRSLNSGQICQMAGLYRSVAADLARAKTHQVGNLLIQDLQKLTARAYTQVYQGSRPQDWQGVIEFWRWGLPAVVRETWVYTAWATGIFLTTALVAWWYAWGDPVFMSLMVPQSLISQVRDRQELWMGSIVGVEPWASSNIMVNNLSVAFKAVAGGITGGIYTIYILGLNGLHIGTIATLVGQHHLAYPFWAFVFPHGALELPAIFLAGGAGLLIGKALVFPGEYRRRDAIKIYGTQAAQLLFGVVALLILAGIIEGFFSPSPWIPEPIKYMTGMGLFIVLISYCGNKKVEA